MVKWSLDKGRGLIQNLLNFVFALIADTVRTGAVGFAL
jgi:hypothetical protein